MYQALKTEMENMSLISKNSMSSKVTQVHTSRGRKEGGLELIPNPEIEKKKDHFPTCNSQKLEHRRLSMSINGNTEDRQWVPQRDTPCPIDTCITSHNNCHLPLLFWYLAPTSRPGTGKFLIRLAE